MLRIWRIFIVEDFDQTENPLAYRFGADYRQATLWEEEIKVRYQGIA